MWKNDREALLDEVGRPSSIAATSLGRMKQGDPEDKPEQESSEPWKRGRAGTSVGRAVHAVLQSIDLATGEGIADRASAQAAAEGVPGREEEIERLCQVAVGKRYREAGGRVQTVLAGGARGGWHGERFPARVH